MRHPKDVTTPARPVRVRPTAALRDRLTQPGHMPDRIPESVIASLALIQGLSVDVRELLEKQNHSPILWAGILPFDVNGLITRNYETQFQCISIHNLSAATVTLAPGGPGGVAPTVGAGVHQLVAGGSGLFAIMGNSFTVYGTPGSFADVSVSTRWLPGL